MLHAVRYGTRSTTITIATNDAFYYCYRGFDPEDAGKHHAEVPDEAALMRELHMGVHGRTTSPASARVTSSRRGSGSGADWQVDWRVFKSPIAHTRAPSSSRYHHDGGKDR